MSDDILATLRALLQYNPQIFCKSMQGNRGFAAVLSGWKPIGIPVDCCRRTV